MSWKLKLDNMVGKTYLRNGEDCTIISYSQKGDTIKVKTTGRDYEKHPDQMPAFLDVFKPLTGEHEALPVAAAVAAPSKLQKMQNALMDSLDKVQQSPEYIEQAKTISKLVQTGINLAKLELEAISAARS